MWHKVEVHERKLRTEENYKLQLCDVEIAVL